MSSDNASDPLLIKLPLVILSYPHLFEPWAGKPDKDGKKGIPKYSAKFLIHKVDQADLQKLIVQKIREAAALKWPVQPGKKQFLPPNDKLCLIDGDSTNVEENEGYWLLGASETIRPYVVRADRSPVHSEDDLMYPGAVVNAAVRFWAQDNEWGKRVNANLIGVQFRKHGIRLAGAERPAADDVFDEEEDFGDEGGGGGSSPNSDDPFA